MKSIYNKTSLFAQTLGALLCVFLCSCTSPTIDDDLDDISGQKAPVSKSSLITEDILEYYVFDTLTSTLYYHFNGMCYAKNGEMVWKPKLDHSSKYYSYRLSGDTLFFFNSSSLVKTYVREIDDGTAFGGRWILQEDESEIFTPEYLIVSDLTAIWVYSIKENAPVTSTDAFTLIMQDIAAEQDGTQHPHQGDYGWVPDWHMMFSKNHENHLTDEELYEFCDPCKDIVRTNNSIKFTRKGKRFEISLKDPVYNEKRMSYSFKISTDEKSCVLFAELIDATKDVCQTKEYWPDEIIEDHTYTALGKTVDYDEFLKCFKELINK